MAGFAGFYHSLTCFPSVSHTRRHSTCDFSKRGRFKRRLPVLVHRYIYNRSKPDSWGTFPLLLSVMLSNSPCLRSVAFTWLYCTLVMGREYLARLHGKAQSAGVDRSLTRSEPLDQPCMNPAYWKPGDWFPYSGGAGQSALLMKSPYSIKRLRLSKTVVMRRTQILKLIAC